MVASTKKRNGGANNTSASNASKSSTTTRSGGGISKKSGGSGSNRSSSTTLLDPHKIGAALAAHVCQSGAGAGCGGNPSLHHHSTSELQHESRSAGGQLKSTAILALMLNKVERAYVSTLDKSARKRIVSFLRDHQHTAPSVPLRVRVLESHLPDAFKQHLFETLEEDDEKCVAMVSQALRLPFDRYTPKDDLVRRQTPAAFLHGARCAMDDVLAGQDRVKCEVLTMLARWRAGGAESTFALGLEGPPGIGKTTFVKHALGRVLQRPVVVMCLGGATDASTLLGHGYTYHGARPGRLSEALMEAGTMDCILFFDELDKVSETPKGEEVISALIHLTDPMQPTLQDRYFQGLDIDFGRCIKVFSYNDPRRVHPVLLDRLKRIAMEVPTEAQKLDIARDHLLPRLRAQTCCDRPVADEALRTIVAHHNDAPGMRGVERTLHNVLSVAFLCDQCTEMPAVSESFAIEREFKLLFPPSARAAATSSHRRALTSRVGSGAIVDSEDGDDVCVSVASRKMQCSSTALVRALPPPVAIGDQFVRCVLQRTKMEDTQPVAHSLMYM